ncbi:MAG: hypothetical protein RSG52_04935 [Terrisporobacter sp.]|uniref:hypothetical protein n=1 Tax=Terrisporobacter sp. TaxID=1965305 RepID=UPI002FC75B1A
MSIGKKKAKKGSLGTSFIVEKIPGLKRISCSNCTNYNNDNSCSAKPVFITEIGYNYWTHCDSFSLDDRYDSEENRMIVNRSRKPKNKKKKKKKKKKNNTNNVVNNIEISIYPTEKSSEAYEYAKRGRTQEEKLSDERARNAAQQRQLKKSKEDSQKYEKLMIKIGQRRKIENLYISHFKKEIDTLDFLDKMDEILEGKDIKSSDLVFIREYLYKKVM